VLKLYEVRVFRVGREIRDVAPFVTTLDLDDALGTRDLLNRHVRGAAARNGAPASELHLFHLELRETSGGRGRGDVLMRWAMPAPEVS
jgi:hypothetical protein